MILSCASAPDEDARTMLAAMIMRRGIQMFMVLSLNAACTHLSLNGARCQCGCGRHYSILREWFEYVRRLSNAGFRRRNTDDGGQSKTQVSRSGKNAFFSC